MDTISSAHHVVRREVPEKWVQPSCVRSVLKLAVYVVGLVGLVWVLVRAQNVWLVLGAQIALGVVFAHGLELQHECLHHNMFRSPSLNRFWGVALGVPMLVPYTHYKVQHLHHHKFVGTPLDEEIFDYHAMQFGSISGLVSRAWNFARIPTFLLTFIGILQGRLPPSFKYESKKRSHLKHEYWLLAFLLGVAVIVTASSSTHLLVRIWFIPWLLVGELVHVLIELPEHIGCDRDVKDPLRNTRSYTTNRIWQYVVNGNNFHIEHHVWPNVSTGYLSRANELIRGGEARCAPSYWAAISAVFAAIRESGKKQDQEGTLVDTLFRVPPTDGDQPM